MERNLYNFGHQRREALANSRIEICYNTRIETVNQDHNSAWAETEHGEILHADILIGADGHRSTVRRHVDPHNPNATYAGYIVWIINTIAEEDLPKEAKPININTGVNMFHGPNGFLFGNVLDSDDGSLGSNNRRIGCAWYDNSRSELLYRLGCVKDNVVLHSLKGNEIPEDTLDELAELARDAWPEPWLSASLLALKTRSLTGIPIKEYSPNKLTRGRVAIIGDAAHVPAPITASGFNESLQDAVKLGKCVTKGVKGNEAFEALEKYESSRLNKVRRMVDSGKFFGKSFGRP